MSESTNSNDFPSLGTLNRKPFLSLAQIPSIVAEWGALIPLVCHLANAQHDYQLAGEIALMGRLCWGLFPKLGFASNIAQLQEEGMVYLERVSTIGGISCQVWDVNWGSTFPCANGAASVMITQLALKQVRGGTIELPESFQDLRKIPTGRSRDTKESKTESHSRTACAQNPTQATVSPFRRYQELHVLKFTRSVAKSSWYNRLHDLLDSLCFEVLAVFFLSSISVLLGLYGLYGTAAAVITSVISRMACRCVDLRRPAGFLSNNEQHDACMLVGLHQNSSLWYLYVGDRGVVDHLLNKPMVGLYSRNIWLSRWFKIAHVVGNVFDRFLL